MSKGLAGFFGTLALLAALRVAMAFILVSESLRLPLSLLVTVVFVALPVFALFRASSHPWTWRLAVAFVAVGLAIHLVLPLASPSGKGLAPILVDAVSQQGLPVWTVGLGALLALLLKDKNLLLPVAIFLALFDIFLVFTPVGFVQVLMKQAPNLLPAMAHNIPEIATAPAATGKPVGTFAHVGPADFLFMGMFFIALHRFGLRTKATLIWLMIALAVYIPLAFILGPVPLMVPIGLTVLLVNLPEFKMTLEEKVSTALVALIGIAIVGYAATRPKPTEPAAPSPTGTVQVPAGSVGSPAPVSPGPRR